MASSSQTPTSVVNLDTGGTAFVNPGNAAGAPNGVGTTVAADGPTDRLDASGFTFDLPVGAVITGIQVVVVSKGGLVS